MISLPSIATTNKVALNLSEPSTYAGLAIIAGQLGAHLPASYGTYVNAACYLFAAVATFLTQKHDLAPAAPAAAPAAPAQVQ